MDDLPSWGEKENDESEGGATLTPSPFRMDFENYTIGRLVPERRNYDYKHDGYKRIKARILWRIEQLGWPGESFEKIDRSIARDQNWSRSGNESKKTDRYGKKYSWIAYFEMSGLLRDQGEIAKIYDHERTSDVDIDPSFPKRILNAKLIDSDFLGDPKLEMDAWISVGEQPDMARYLMMARIVDHDGPWIALDGFVVQEDEKRGRESFCFIRSLIVKNERADEFVERLSRQDLTDRRLPEKPSVIYTFSGEIPWCATYPANGPTEFLFVESETNYYCQKDSALNCLFTTVSRTFLKLI